jgi:hypothetical protein
MIVTVHALFSHNDMIGSKIISKGSKHLAPDMPETSHVSVLVNERWVHEATGAGVKIYSYDLWKTVHTEVGRVKLEDRQYQEIADQFRLIKDKKYDYPGVFFLALCIVPTYFGLPLRPEKNLCESKDKFFCCEVLGFLTNMYYGMSAPVQIFSKLKKIYG